MNGTWCNTREARDRLGGIAVHALAYLMGDSDRAGLDRPWVNIGAGARPTWRWRVEQLEPWHLAVMTWRAEQAEAARARHQALASARAAEPSRAPGTRRPRVERSSLLALAKTLVAAR